VQPKRKKRLVVFDLDDTLYPERDFVLSGFREVDRHLSENYQLSGFCNLAKALFEKGQRGRIFDEVIKYLLGNEAASQEAERLISELVGVYRGHNPDIDLFKDARWALTYFWPRMRTALLSDGYLLTQQQKITALGIANQFDAIVLSDEYGRTSWKPSPVPYLKCMELTNISGSHCTYIADNPAKDFVTAKALGWRTVQIQRDEGEYSSVSNVQDSHTPHATIRSLTQLEGIL